jgi:single-strand DNA-binding protein
MININRVVLVGRLTRDVEVRKTASGLSVASFTVAVSRRYSRQDNQNSNQPTADFISCVAWRQSADFLGNYGKKGTLVGIEGRIQTRSYDANDGHKVYVTEVICDSVELERRNDGSSGGSYGQNSYGSGNGYGGNNGYTTSYNNSGNSYNSNNDNGGQSQNDENPGDALGITGNDLPF